jgi:hypothetical protein
MSKVGHFILGMFVGLFICICLITYLAYAKRKVEQKESLSSTPGEVVMEWQLYNQKLWEEAHAEET